MKGRDIECHLNLEHHATMANFTKSTKSNYKNQNYIKTHHQRDNKPYIRLGNDNIITLIKVNR